jgi:pre-60S factor REI1
MSSFTCITCNVGFAASEVQREHYKSDWHRYNLKRKVAELPPVTAENFQERVKAHKAEATADQSQATLYCTTCRKRFSTENAYYNHAQSRKHFEQLEKTPPSTGISEEILLKNEKNTAITQSLSPPKRLDKTTGQQAASTSVENGSDEEEEGDWEDVEEEPLTPKQCLFCSNESDSLEENVKHMTVVHSFFIPDIEFLSDLEGLITYLGEKVGVGNVCLWCNERGKSFNSTKAVQNHMLDKGHCKILHEGEVLAEYEEYYDYSTSYPEGDPSAVDREGREDDVEESVLDDGDYQLVLPSGAIIGHRSLLRYYKQKLPPERQIAKSKSAIHRVMHHYKALGWTGTTGEAAVRHARDVRYMRNYQMKYQMKLGVRANKLQHHFRPQVNF